MRLPAVAALLLLASTALAAPPAAPPAGDAADALEKELSLLGKKLDALKGELDRVDDMASAPAPTSAALEISGEGGVPAPTGYRLLVDGRVEEERDFGRVERELFSRAEGATPLSVRVPLLPGSHSIRLDLSGPGWKAPASSELPVTLRKGETVPLRLRLSPPGTKGGDPVLRPER